MRQAGKLLLIAVFLCLPVACEPGGNNPGGNSASNSASNGVYLCFTIPLPEGWHPAEIYHLDTNGGNEQESVILYRFDLPYETGLHGGPIRAIVYQMDDKKPPNIFVYELRTPDSDYLCECQCTLTTDGVLSGLEGSELVVRDVCDGERTRLTIFHWDSGQVTYVSRGHFHGHEIEVTPNQVIVEERLLDRAQLARREIYHPLDDTTYYQSENPIVLVPYDKVELVFSHGEPKEIVSSPYPEKIVLSFYNHYTETEKVRTYFTAAGWEQLGQCNVSQWGCLSAHSDITHVRVTELYLETEQVYTSKDSPDLATVRATVICEHLNGAPDAGTPVWWHLIRGEDNLWKLDRVE